MKIVFRSSNVNKAYTIDYQVQNVEAGNTIRSGVRNLNILVVTPRSGYIVDANDFSHGLLPKDVASVSFSNSSNNIDYSNQVRVHITLDLKFTVRGVKNIVFDIPISGQGMLPANKVDLIVRVPQNNNISQTTLLGNGVKASPASLVNNTLTTTYSLEAKKGSKILLFQKEFIAFKGFYFSTPPTYKLNALQRSRYQIQMFNKYDNKKRLLLRRISVHYTFPTENIKSKDYLELSTSVSKEVVARKDTNYSSSLKPTIFSVKTLSVAGPNGGFVPLEVRGTPGSPFSVAIQNTAKQVYDRDTGKFENGGKFITGTIPLGGDRKTIGVYRTLVKMPSIFQNNTDANAPNFVADVSQGNSIETRLIVEKEVSTNIKPYKDEREGFDDGSVITTDQQANTEIIIFPDYAYSPNGTNGANPVSSFNHTKSTFSKLDSSNFSQISKTALADGSTRDAASIQIFGNAKENHGFTYNFEYLIGVTGATYGTNGLIRIIRQPRFILFNGDEKSDTSFRPWMCDPEGGMTCDDANEKDISISTGEKRQILNDFFATPASSQESVQGNSKSSYRIGASVSGFGKPIKSTGAASGDSLTYDYYRKIIIKGSISGIVLPTEKLLLQLKLQNFLTLKNIT